MQYVKTELLYALEWVTPRWIRNVMSNVSTLFRDKLADRREEILILDRNICKVQESLDLTAATVASDVSAIRHRLEKKQGCDDATRDNIKRLGDHLSSQEVTLRILREGIIDKKFEVSKKDLLFVKHATNAGLRCPECKVNVKSARAKHCNNCAKRGRPKNGKH